jgi:hypothetical protein
MGGLMHKELGEKRSRLSTAAGDRPISLSFVNAAHGLTKLQPVGRVGPKAPPTKTLLFKYQIAVLRVLVLNRA